MDHHPVEVVVTIHGDANRPTYDELQVRCGCTDSLAHDWGHHLTRTP